MASAVYETEICFAAGKVDLVTSAYWPFQSVCEEDLDIVFNDTE